MLLRRYHNVRAKRGAPINGLKLINWCNYNTLRKVQTPLFSSYCVLATFKWLIRLSHNYIWLNAWRLWRLAVQCEVGVIASCECNSRQLHLRSTLVPKRGKSCWEMLVKAIKLRRSCKLLWEQFFMTYWFQLVNLDSEPNPSISFSLGVFPSEHYCRYSTSTTECRCKLLLPLQNTFVFLLSFF